MRILGVTKQGGAIATRQLVTLDHQFPLIEARSAKSTNCIARESHENVVYRSKLFII